MGGCGRNLGCTWCGEGFRWSEGSSAYSLPPGSADLRMSLK